MLFVYLERENLMDKTRAAQAELDSVLPSVMVAFGFYNATFDDAMPQTE